MSVTRRVLVFVTAGGVALVLAGLQHGAVLEGDQEATPVGVVTAPAPRLRAPVRTMSTQQPAESHGAAEVHQDRAASDLRDAFTTALQDTTSQRRIEALRFLGEHASQGDLEALQRIQIQDPSPEVRRAAEEAVHLLMRRFSGQPWPGIPSGKHPFDYMGGAASPTIP